VPETLLQVLKHIALDFVPETTAAAACINAWLEQQNELEPSTEAQRGVGMCQFNVRGSEINALAQPFRFYLLKRVQDLYERMDAHDQAAGLAMLTACGMTDLLDIKLSRDIVRHNNLEVWR